MDCPLHNKANPIPLQEQNRTETVRIPSSLLPIPTHAEAEHRRQQEEGQGKPDTRHSSRSTRHNREFFRRFGPGVCYYRYSFLPRNEKRTRRHVNFVHRHKGVGEVSLLCELATERRKAPPDVMSHSRHPSFVLLLHCNATQVESGPQREANK